MNAPFAESDAWRVAALTMMSPAKLQTIFSGDPIAAAPWVIAAANSGLPEAQVRLGRMALSGEGVPQDRTAAFAWFSQAAEAGSIDAHNMRGRCFEKGWGISQNFTRAAECYAIAAEAGHAWAQYNLGHIYLDGNGIPRDLGEAFALYMRASEQGHVRAMNLVARCYEEGWSVPRDTSIARTWYRKSAEGGYFRGAYNYATLLLSEDCVAGAAHWFEKAIASAPEPTRAYMVGILMQSSHRTLRRVALGMSAQTGATAGLI